MKTLKIAALCGLFMLSAGAQAEFIKGNWQSDGDQQISLDTETGLEWLNLGNTGNLDMADYGTGVQDTGLFKGFRVATQSEVESMLKRLWNTETLPHTGGWESNGGETWDNLVKLEKTMGIVSKTDSQGYWYHYTNAGYLSDDKTELKRTVSLTFGYQFKSYFEMDHNYVPDRYNIGIFFVSTGGHTYSSQNDSEYSSHLTSVPLGSTGLLLGSALLGFGLRRKTK